MTDIMNTLLTGTDLTTEGRESADLSTGFPQYVPSGYYLVSLNRFATLGPVPKMQKNQQGVMEVKSSEQIKVGFEILKCVKAINPMAETFKLVKSYKNEKTGETDLVPYTVDIGGMFNMTLSQSSKSNMAKVLPVMRSALPFYVKDEVKASGKTLEDVYPTLKSMFGQQFIIYIQEIDNGKPKGKGHRIDNVIMPSTTQAPALTAYNNRKGADGKLISVEPKTVVAGLEMYSHDEGLRDPGFTAQEKGTPLHTRCILFDIDAKDMSQAHLDTVAHEKVFIGKDCIPGKESTIEFCDLLDVNMRLGKYSDFAVSNLIKSKVLTIPAPKPRKNKDGETAPDANFDDAKALDMSTTETPALDTISV